jgi:uncharacterized protein YfkK (UPF0435 family)
MVKNTCYLLLSIILFSCGDKKQENTKNEAIKPLLRVVEKHLPTENIHLKFTKDVENWQELQAVNSFLKKFENVSPNEVLSNALELRDLVKNLKDSVVPVIFNIPSFKARVNVLNSETLRLADLTFIPAIEPEEINTQVNKTIAAFSAVNSKINTILSEKSFEDAIDVNLDFIGIDSTKIDSVSKNSIKDIRREKLREGPPVKRKILKPKKK